MSRITFLLTAFFLAACGTDPQPRADEGPVEGTWRMEMTSPGGPLPFTMTLTRAGDSWRAVAHNGDERVPLDVVRVGEDGSVTLGIDHYESYFKGTLSMDGTRIVGFWEKVAGPDKRARLPFVAVAGETHRFAPGPEAAVDVSGRYAVTFDNHGDPQPAVAELRHEGDRLLGTFLTPVGDYRYLEGTVRGHTLSLSCFDGGHAFLFVAEIDGRGHLAGDFWSRDSWHETWTAVPDEDAELEDAFAMTRLAEGADRFRFSFPDLEGETVSWDDPDLEGKVRLITIFGSWCPNCNDEAPFLETLYRAYGPRGLEVVGLAFEMTGEEARDRKVLKRFAKRHDLSYRILLAGGSTDKDKASATLPDLEHVLAYPTTLLIDRSGEVVRIHTGFSGPGTGRHHEELTRRYRTEIEALL